MKLFDLSKMEIEYEPPTGSNVYIDVGGGVIELSGVSDSPKTYDISIESGSIPVESFEVEDPYNVFTVKTGSELEVYGTLKIHNTPYTHAVHGSIVLKSGSTLSLESGAVLIFYPDSTLTIEDGAAIDIDDAAVYVYGRVNVSVEEAERVLNNEQFIIDSIAVLDVTNIDLGDRVYSLHDYEKDLREKLINPYTQGEYNSGKFKVGYVWRAGARSSHSQVIDIDIMRGKVILGDFKFQCLGSQKKLVENIQVVRDIKISKEGELHVSTSFEECEYLHPELYLGIITENVSTPAKCVVEGKLVADTPDSIITVDRCATLHIEEGGVVDISNGAILRCTHVDDNEEYDPLVPIIYINGTLYVDRLEQLIIPCPENIVFGEKGKLIVRNLYDREGGVVLFSTPDGVVDSELYRLFWNENHRLENVEYIIPSNCGIKIDRYFQFYNTELTDWYAGRRFEKAVKDGLLRWEGGFIELNSDVIPWVNMYCTLYDIVKMFKNSATNDKDRVQEVADHMKYCGTGDVVFRLVDDSLHKDLVMRISKPTVKTAAYDAEEEAYEFDIDGGNTKLFFRNNIGAANVKNLIVDNAKIVDVKDSVLVAL